MGYSLLPQSLLCHEHNTNHKMGRLRRRTKRGRARTQRSRKRRRVVGTIRREITPTASECRARGLIVYRSSLAPVPVDKPPSRKLQWSCELWKQKVASRSVLRWMVRKRRYGLVSAHSDWSRGDSCYGDEFEYCYRLKYPIPFHLPRAAMKAIVLFTATEPETFDEGNPLESWETEIFDISYEDFPHHFV